MELDKTGSSGGASKKRDKGKAKSTQTGSPATAQQQQQQLHIAGRSELDVYAVAGDMTTDVWKILQEILASDEDCLAKLKEKETKLRMQMHQSFVSSLEIVRTSSYASGASSHVDLPVFVGDTLLQ